MPFAYLQSTLGMHVSLRETRGGSRIQTWNRYAYVANNPLSFIDPLGLYRCIVDGVETDNCPYGGVGGGGGGGGFPIYTTGTCQSPYPNNDGGAVYQSCLVLAGYKNGFGGGGGGGGGGGSGAPSNNTQKPQQPRHFWQKPGCGSAIGQTALGLAGSAIEVGAVIFVGPELLAAAGAEAGGAALLEGGEIVESGMSVAHVATGLGTLLAAPAVLTANGTMGIFNNCF